MTIPIVMTVDENYTLQIMTTIHSFRVNTDKNTVLKVIVLCTKGLKQSERNKVASMEKKHVNLCIMFKEVDDKLFLKAAPKGHVTVCSYYRLAMDQLIDDDKCLFLDSDIIVQGDLSNLFSIDVEDYYLAGVLDVGFRVNPEFALAHSKEDGILFMDKYVNAGVLVFNLKKIRDDNMGANLIKEIAHHRYLYDDQDILNKVLYEKIKLIPEKFNCFHSFSNGRNFRWRTEQEPLVLHFAGPFKPWKWLKVRHSEVWWKYAGEIIDKDELCSLKRKAQQFTDGLDWNYLMELLINESDIVVVGCSYIGIKVCDGLRKNGIKASITMSDNYSEKYKSANAGFDVMSVKDAILQHPNAFWINTSQRYTKEIHDQLIGAGIKEEKQWWYFDKPPEYLECLDENYYEKELLEKKYI